MTKLLVIGNIKNKLTVLSYHFPLLSNVLIFRVICSRQGKREIRLTGLLQDLKHVLVMDFVVCVPRPSSPNSAGFCVGTSIPPATS